MPSLASFAPSPQSGSELRSRWSMRPAGKAERHTELFRRRQKERQAEVEETMGKRILIFDTTLRDGEQAPGCSMNTKEKLEMARQLARLKVDVIEAGFAIASEDDFEAVKTIAQN